MEPTIRTHFSKRLLSTCSYLHRQKQAELYNMSYKRNSLSRMRTVTPENQHQRLWESATPLAKLPYSDQLTIKRAALERALRKMVNIIQHNKRGRMTPALEQSVEENEGCICPLTDMKPAPRTEGTRNKEELSVYLGVDGDPNTVGLIIGRGVNGRCVPCEGLVNTKPLHHEVIKNFRAFLAQSELRRGATKVSPQGHYQQQYWGKLVIRSNEAGQVMLVPELKCSHVSQDAVDRAKEELLHFYGGLSPASEAVHSLYLRLSTRFSKTYHSQYHIQGDTHICEEILGHRFRISPEAFFQLNTPGAAVLYREVQELVQACQPQTLLDIGCGTGTIGILMSGLVEKVIGMDVVEQAVQDARFNATLNGVDNAQFVWGSARKLLKSYMTGDTTVRDRTLAVVNPNRNGLNKKAIQRLRCCEPIKDLIYISCKPHGNALINFVDLIVPESEDHPGQAFKAVKAVGVDLFPHTVHSELVLLFQR